ncbi:putative COP1-interactive protein [Trifolium pratense]|uniref:Putative COP1-interactive protein n=1 Tax=Trifolium pratense TaxID=57577 RepID=A0A2K3MWG7_TRIPR|nr:putative COP1-interactive protein [Trifolium pratense]
MEEIHIDPKTEIEDKVKGILKLIKDGELDMDGTPEEILKREPLAELVKNIENIINELNVLHKEVESLQHQKSDSEVIEDRDKLTMELEKLKLEMSTIMSKHSEEKNQMITYYAEICHGKIAAPLHSLCRQKREVEEQLRANEQQLRANERELNTLKQKASDYENQISAYRNEISELAWENLEQEEKLGKLEGGLKARKLECSALQRKLNTAEKDASGKMIAFTAEVDNLQKDMLSLKKTKEELELNCEKLREEHVQTLTIVDDENKELANKIMDLQRTLKEQEDAYQKLNEEYKQVDSRFNECKVKPEVANRKIEEKTEELHESIASKDQMVDDLEQQVEDLKRDLGENVKNHEEKLRLSNQKLQDTEQLLSEKEEEFQQVQRELEERNATLVATITANNEAFQETIKGIEVCVDSVIFGIDTVSKKFTDNCNNYENSITDISHELQVVKEYASKINREKGKLQEDKMLLLEVLQGIKEEELTLMKKVENLEAKARKEESKKMNEISKLAQEKSEIECKKDQLERRLISFTGCVDNLPKDLLSLKTTKEKLELYRNKIIEEHAKILTMVDNELANKNTDLQRIFEQMAEECNEHIVSKNMMVAHLESQLEDLSMLIKEKEEGMRQKQMEAIRKLSLQVHDLRKYNDDLKEIISKCRSYCCLC